MWSINSLLTNKALLIPKNTKVYPKSLNILNSQKLSGTKGFFSYYLPSENWVFSSLELMAGRFLAPKVYYVNSFFQLPNYALLLSSSGLGKNEAEHYHNGGKICGK